MAKDFYAILGVPRTASEDTLRQRFRELARERHPDRFRGDEKAQAEKDFQDITQAFNVLSDPERRRSHDAELARPQEISDPRQLVRVYLQRGIRAYKEKNYFEAADNFDRATKADPGSAQAWHHLALACSQQPSWMERAVAAVERACELEPMNPSYRKLAGRVSVLAGATESAERHYRAALEWGGDDAETRQALQDLTKSSRRGFFGKTG